MEKVVIEDVYAMTARRGHVMGYLISIQEYPLEMVIKFANGGELYEWRPAMFHL
jgi:hypothetical protein